MPTGRRRSSASCPSSPAVRASSANPRSSSAGRPRSASAAPQVPAPLSGRVRPSTCGWTRPIASNRRRCGPRSPSSSAMRDQYRGAGVGDLVHRVAEAGDEPARGAGPLHRGERQRVIARVVGGRRLAGPASASARNRPASSVTPRKREPPPSRPGGQRSLHRVGRAQVGQPGRDRGRGEAVVGQRHQDRLEHPDLRRGRPVLGDQPQRQLAEPDLAHEVGGEIPAEQGDRVRVGGAQRGGEAGHGGRRVRLGHVRPAVRWASPAGTGCPGRRARPGSGRRARRGRAAAAS